MDAQSGVGEGLIIRRFRGLDPMDVIESCDFALDGGSLDDSTGIAPLGPWPSWEPCSTANLLFRCDRSGDDKICESPERGEDS